MEIEGATGGGYRDQEARVYARNLGWLFFLMQCDYDQNIYMIGTFSK